MTDLIIPSIVAFTVAGTCLIVVFIIDEIWCRYRNLKQAGTRPCPLCGGTGRVQNDTYHMDGDR